MSVTIFYRPTSNKDFHFSSGTTSALEQIKAIFGRTVGPDDIRTLRALSKALKDSFYDDVADKIEEIGEIEIWGEY